MKKTVYLLAIVFMVSLIAVSVVAEENSKISMDDPRYGGKLVIGKASGPRNMDSRWTTWGDAAHSLKNEPMFMPIPSGGPTDITHAGWIDSYEFPKNKTLILHLKEGVTYQDGVPLDAEAVKWGILKRLTTKKLWSADFTVAHPENPEKDIEVVDDTTVKIHLKRPDPLLPVRLASYTAWAWASETPRARKRYGEEYGSKMAYGNGPFVFKEWVRGDHLTFERYEKYWWSPPFIDHKGPAYLKEITFRYIPEATTRIQMLKTGKLDMLFSVPPPFYQSLKDNKKFKVQSALTGKDLEVIFNVTNSPLDEIEVRKALGLAIERGPIIEVAYEGLAEPQHTLYTVKSHVRETTKRVNYDLGKAKSVLKEAGWVDRDGDGFREKDGKDLKVKLWTQGVKQKKLAAQIIQQMWKSVGVKVDITTMERGTLVSKAEAGDHEALLYSHESTARSDLRWFYNPNSTWGYPHFEYSDTQKLRDLISKTFEAQHESLESYSKAMDNLVNYVTNEYYRVPVARIKRAIAFDDGLKNVQIRGESYWSPLPLMHDVYWEHIRKENE
ncbi:MAG: ABC transporter substrate-binding protein [Candidatus Bipolaricaulia bacterium]